MFSASQVDGLFSDCTRTLQRSLVVTGERRGAPAAASSPATPSEHLSSLTHSDSHFLCTVQTLRHLSQLRLLLETAAEMAAELEQVSPHVSSPTVSRQKGAKYSMTQRMVKVLRVRQEVWGWTGLATAAQAERLWWDESQGGGGEVGLASRQDPASSGAGAACGALVCAQLVLAGVLADTWRNASVATAQMASLSQQLLESSPADREADAGVSPAASDVQVWMRDGGLGKLLRSAMSALPDPVAEYLLYRLTEALEAASASSSCFSSKSQGGTNAARRPRLPLGMLLLPSVPALLALGPSPYMGERRLCDPLAALASRLLPLYLTDVDEFDEACSECIAYTTMLSAQLMATVATAASDAAASVSDKKASETVSIQRVSTVLKQVLGALLGAIETAFTASASRPGLAAHVHSVLAAPLQRACAALFNFGLCTPNAHVTGGAGAPHGTAMSPFSSILCTALYRLLLVVETLGRAELGAMNGTTSAAVQQKRYRSMLKQSNGKMTHALLSAVAEDKRLLMEETAARSPTGHRIYKIYDGGSTAVFVYIQDGSVYVKKTREKAFRQAKSVEEVFKSFDES